MCALSNAFYNNFSTYLKSNASKTFTFVLKRIYLKHHSFTITQCINTFTLMDLIFHDSIFQPSQGFTLNDMKAEENL